MPSPPDLEALLAASPVAALVIRRRRVVWANPAALHLVEQEADELLGRPYTDLFPAGERERVDARQERRLRGLPEPPVYETSMRCGWQVRPVQVHVACSGDAVIVQLLDFSAEAVRRLRLATLSRFGAAVRREPRREDVVRTARETLAGLGVEYALLLPDGDELRLERADLEPWRLRRISRAVGSAEVVGSTRPWSPLDREAWSQGTAFTDDWRMAGELLAEWLLEAERALPPTRRVSAIAVRIDVSGAPQALLVAVAPWLRVEDLPTFRLFGAQIGAALDTALAVDTLASRDAALGALNRVAEAASLAPDLGAFLERASAEVRAVTACEVVAFYLLDSGRAEARLLHLEGADAAARRDLGRLAAADLGLDERGRDAVARVVQLAEVKPSPTRERLDRLGIVTLTLVPLRFRSALIGTVVVGFRQRRRAETSHLDVLQAMASHFAGALDTHRLLGDLRVRVAELTLLNDVALATAAVEPEQLLERALQRVAATFRADAGGVFLVDGDGLRQVSALGFSATTRTGTGRLPLSTGMLATAVAERRTVHVVGHAGDAQEMSWIWFQEQLAVAVAVPLMVRDRVLGALVLSRRRQEPFSAANLSLLSSVGVQLGVALENARLYGEARHRVEELSAASAGLARAQDQAVRRERLAAIGELAAVVAHEVRNPLGVIFNSLASLRRMVKPAGDALLLFDMASEEATRLNRIVGDLLDFARPSPLELRLEPLERVVDGAVAAALGTGGGRVALVREVPEDLPPVPMDARLVRQAVLNVAMNAVQAMPEGGTLTVRLRAGEAAVSLAVADTGPGIPEGVRGRLFEPFFTTRPTGTGLGLAVVKRIVDDHRGTLEVTAAPGGGACFTLHLPLRPAALPPPVG